MTTDSLSSYAAFRREVAERLCTFFIAAGDGRASSNEIDAALASSQGPHRPQNEDRCAAVRFKFGTVRPDIRLAVLCDGMGGMAKGGEAASMALASFIAAFGAADADRSLDQRLERACNFANRAVYHTFHGEAGTTLTAVAVGAGTSYAIHVGDSRLYAVDAHRDVRLITKDDTVSGAVNAHYGQDDEDDLDNRLLQFVGIGHALDPHLISLKEYPEAEFWLLTSDGTHSIGKRALLGVCQGSKNSLELVRKLVYVSEAIDTQDNSTALCMRANRVGPFNDDQHEGLTLQISTPDRGLDIWMPQTALQLSRSEPKESRYEEPTSSRIGLAKAVKELPRAAKTKSRRTAPRKRRPAKDKPLKRDQSGLPMEVIFDISPNDG